MSDSGTPIEVHVRRAVAAISILSFFGFGTYSVLTLLQMPQEESEPASPPVTPERNLEALKEFVEREAERMNQAGGLPRSRAQETRCASDEYAKALESAALTGIAPEWAKECGTRIERRRRVEPASIDEIIRRNDNVRRDITADDRVRFSLTTAIVIPAILWSVFFFCRWLSFPRETGLIRPHGEVLSMKRGELVILWVGGMLSILTLIYKPLLDLDGYGFREFADHPVKTLFAIWILCFLIWATKYGRKR